MMAWFILCLAVLSVVTVCVAASQALWEKQDHFGTRVSKRDTLQGSWFFVQEVNENVLLHVYLFPNASNSSTFSFNETLLQAECTGTQRQWNRCNILLIADEEGLEQLVLFPVRGGISIVHLDHGFSSILNYTRISSDDLPCHPTTLWRQQNKIHLACLHLNQSGEHGECKVYRMKLNLDRSDFSQSYFEGQMRIFSMNYPELLTNFVIDSLQSCFIPGPQVYFAWFDRLYRSIPNRLVANNPYRLFTERCSQVTEVERYDDLHISALCPAGTQELVNLCTGDIEHSNLTTGLPRACSHSTEIVVNVTNHGFVVINSSSSTPSVVEVDTGNITHTRCIQGDSMAWLTIESSNLTVTALRTDDLSILTLTTNNTLDGVSVGRVEVWGERYVGFANGTHYLVKDINCLRGNPLFVLQFIPDLNLKLGDSPLECTVQSSASIMPSMAGSVSTISYSLSSTPTITIPTRTSSKQKTPVIVGVISAIVLLAAVVFATTIACIWKKRHKNGDSLTLQSNLQTSQHATNNISVTWFTASGATPTTSGATPPNPPTLQANGPESGGTGARPKNHTPDVPLLELAKPTGGATPVSGAEPNSPTSSPEGRVPMPSKPAESLSEATPALKSHPSSVTSSPGRHDPSKGTDSRARSPNTPSPRHKPTSETVPVQEEGRGKSQQVFERRRARPQDTHRESSRSVSPPPNEYLSQSQHVPALPAVNQNLVNARAVAETPLPLPPLPQHYPPQPQPQPRAQAQAQPQPQPQPQAQAQAQAAQQQQHPDHDPMTGQPDKS